MKSIKPGRAPSAMGVWFAIVAVVFGIFWTIMAANMRAPALFIVFGILFVITGIGIGIYNYKNATGKHRYSAFDITNDSEEPDPLNERFGPQGDGVSAQSSDGFCPYCGAKADAGYAFCRKCGKKLPN